MIKKVVIVGLFAAGLPASTATAHPGHGKVGEGHELKHYLTEPIHLAAGIAVVVVAIAVMMFVRKFVRVTRNSSRRQLGET